MGQLFVESWIWYAFVSAFCLLRLTSRCIHQGGFKQLQPDDFLIVVALAFYTVLVSYAVQVASFPLDALLNPAVAGLNPAQDITAPSSTRIHDFEKLSKIIIVVEQCLIATVWLVKACLLCLYFRIATTRLQSFVVKSIILYVALTLIVMEILFFHHWCLPFAHYWNYWSTSANCTAMTDHLIAYAAFDISSDLAMILFLLPLLVRSAYPARSRLALAAALALVAFVVFCAAAGKYYSFTNTTGTLWVNWYIREASTAIILANLPSLAPLTRRLAAAVKSRDPSILLLARCDTLDTQPRGDTASSMKSTLGPLDGEVRVLTTIETRLEKRADCNPFDDLCLLEEGAGGRRGYVHREAWDERPWTDGCDGGVAIAKGPAYVERLVFGDGPESEAGASSPRGASPLLPSHEISKG